MQKEGLKRGQAQHRQLRLTVKRIGDIGIRIVLLPSQGSEKAGKEIKKWEKKRGADRINEVGRR